MSRAGDIPEGSWICLSHRNLILAEDKSCSMFLQFLAHTQTFDRGVSGGSRRFYLNFYSLHLVTGNVGDTGNDVTLFGNGKLQEILSERVGCVGTLVLMLKISSR